MIGPNLLADRLEELVVLLRRQGEVTWGRVSDWETARMPAFREPLDDDQDAAVRAGRSVRDEEDRKGDAAAARYRDEVDGLASRLLKQSQRLCTIITVCNPDRPKHLGNRDLQAAQVAAEGWCVSCWQDDQTFELSAGGRYRNHCRFCGEWKAANGQDPPVWLLRKRRIHGKRSVTTADVEKATGKAS